MLTEHWTAYHDFKSMIKRPSVAQGVVSDVAMVGTLT